MVTNVRVGSFRLKKINITTIEQIQEAVRSGYFDGIEKYQTVRITPHNGLLLFCYQKSTTYNNDWTPFQRLCRGLVIDRETGDVVARPFDKFFGWNERKDSTTSSPIKRVYEKLDSFLGIVYFYNGQWHMNTKGAFASDLFGKWSFSIKNQDALDPTKTYMFEVLWNPPKGSKLRRYIATRHSVEKVVLLAIRDKRTGEYLEHESLVEHARDVGVECVRSIDFSSVDDILELLPDLDAIKEGFVVLFQDGQRFKFKGEPYLALHRTLNGIRKDWIVELVITGRYPSFIRTVPEEFRNEVKDMKNEFVHKVEARLSEVQSILDLANTSLDRKGFVEWVNTNHSSSKSLILALYNGNRLRLNRLIYKELGVKVQSVESNAVILRIDEALNEDLNAV